MKKLIEFLKNLFKRSTNWVKKVITPSIKTVEVIKQIVNNPALDFLTALTNTDIDNKILNRLRIILPDVLTVMGIVKECSAKGNFNEVVLCAIKHIRSLDKEGQALAYHSLASLLSKYLSDGRLTWSEAIHLVQYVYDEREAIEYKNKNI